MAPFPVVLIDRPKGTAAAGFNAALRASTGEVIVLLGARARPAGADLSAGGLQLRPSGAGAVGGGNVRVKGGGGGAERGIEVTHPGVYLLLEHDRHTPGLLDLQIASGLDCLATCFTPGLA